MSSQKRPLLFKSISIRTVLPSVVTLFAFMSGLTSIKFALSGKWELAVGAVLLAGIFDGLDGTVARLLKSTSKFGAELDSLSDVVAFGVAPAVILYLWVLEGLDRMGWAVALIYASAMALRLARFNARLDDEEEPIKRTGFLTGVPAPMGAGLLLLPMMIDFALGQNLAKENGLIICGYAIVVVFLMVSTLPTLSLKALRAPKAWFVPLLVVIATLIAGLFVRTWLVLIIIGVGYLATMPLTYISYRRRVERKTRG
ncbi:CDP-diacylglycerol--serine O-phosphatidyltransferase [Kordiimonas sp. SCSIO 12603]|uniref:CDP-diacylglycerol--serine O-phosphatidyltransferase n=1 Tax=Kordiimonas sp. SCSIO 12603 TaxID=2829596 RepID=UPI002102E4BA|nr:CDP-diacylglycerol--serine O-phosphatidyltransferase [Kordiimonas sp. SCSIO 12603]